MGCASSKLEDLPAVALCGERCTLMDETTHHRYALAAAHFAYINSLKAIGRSLHLLIQQEQHFTASPPSLSPSSSKNHIAKQPHSSPSHSHTNSGSHLHFHSDSDQDQDQDQDDLPSLHHSNSSHSSPLHLSPNPMTYNNNLDDHHLSFPSRPGMNFNFMTNKPMSPHTVYMNMSEPSPSTSSFHPYPYPHDPYSIPYNNAHAYYASPPPPPPRDSAWNFLNLFDSDDKCHPQYNTPSRGSKEVREEEGIPDLEDEDYEHQLLKQVHGDHNLVDANANHSEPPQDNQLNKSVSTDNEYEVHVDVDKKVVDDDHIHRSKHSRDAFEVAKEIEAQFQRASHSGNEIANMLEVGKLPYHPNHGAYQASSKMLHLVAPSLSIVSSQPSTSKSVESTSTVVKAGHGNSDFDVDLAITSRNLSSTLQKLHLCKVEKLQA